MDDLSALREEINEFKKSREFNRSRYPQSVRMRACKLLVSGVSCEQLASSLGINRAVVEYWAKGLKSIRKNSAKSVDRHRPQATPRVLSVTPTVPTRGDVGRMRPWKFCLALFFGQYSVEVGCMICKC